LCSSFTVALSVWATRHGRKGLTVALLVATMLLGVVFLILKGFEYAEHVRERALPGPYYHFSELPTYGGNRFFTMYWVMTGFHALHVTAGVCVVSWMASRAWRGFYTPVLNAKLVMGTLYWHLVDVIWIFLWPLLYLS
jgi:cytochrome c oxidase subunit 3